MKLKNQVWKNSFFLSKCKFKVSKMPSLLGLRQKWMIPSCSPWKVVTFFGKEHVYWSNISGDMRGWSWKVKFGKVEMGVFALKSCIVTKKIMYFSNLDFCSSINHNIINIGPNDMVYTKKCNYFSQGKRWECLILF